MPDNALNLYPAPPQPNQGMLTGDPSRMLQILPGLADFQARKAVGNALSQSVDPEGNFDPSKFSTLVARDPAANLRSVEAIQNAQELRRQQSELAESQRQIVGNMIGSFAGDTTATPAKVMDFVTRLTRSGIDPRVTLGYKDLLLNPRPAVPLKGETPEQTKQRQFQDTLTNIAVHLMGPAGRAAVVEGGVGPEGTRPLMQAGQLQRQMVQGGGAGGGGAGATTLPPGQAESMAASADRGQKLQATASTTAQTHADLENLKRESRVLDIQGPSAEFEKKFNQLFARLGWNVTMTPEQLAAADSFDKIGNQLSLNQSTMYHGSDAGLHTVIGANPNLSQSKIGREGVIDMLLGNIDAQDVARRLFNEARTKGVPWFNGGRPANQHEHDAFVDELSRHDPERGKIGFDPRVFQFNRLSRKNQQTFLSQLDPDEIAEFEEKYRDAVERRWVKPLKKQAGASK